jgi:hypothetical protein
VLVAAPARAHQASVVYADLALDGRTVAATLQIADTDVAPALGLRERTVSRDEVTAGRDRLLAWVAERLHVDNGGAPCPATRRALDFTDKGGGFFATVRLDFECRRTAADVRVTYDLFFDLDARHQAFARVAVPGQPERQHVFRGDDRVLHASRPAGLADDLRDYLLVGIEHIFTGYDHLAFLFGLLVVAGFARLRAGLRYVLGVVTAFTVAHSLTLVAAGLDWVRLPSRVVEPAIALSIFYVAMENLFVATPRRRWLLTFGFGLIHGFGFASVLREIGLPARGLVASLLSFNVGVELGQLAVVAAIAPFLWLLSRPEPRAVDAAWLPALAAVAFAGLRSFGLPAVQLAIVVFGAPLLLLVAVRRFGYDRAVRLGGSIVLAALAAFWFLERILERTWLGGALG